MTCVTCDSTLTSAADTPCDCRHDQYVTAAVFHPHNMQHYASACFDGKIRLWRCADPACVRDWQQTQSDPVTCLTFSGSGDRVLVGTNHGKFRVFSVSNSMKLEFMDEVGAPPCVHAEIESALLHGICARHRSHVQAVNSVWTRPMCSSLRAVGCCCHNKLHTTY